MKEREEERIRKHQIQIKKMQEKEEDRRKKKEEEESRVKEVVKAKPLYQKYEQKYKQEYELPELELKKKQLEEIRNFYKPIEKK